MFSRYVYTEFLKRKNGDSVVAAFNFFLKKTHHNYSYLQYVEGTEFFNRKLKKLLHKYKIHHYLTYNREMKASLVERFLRTYKGVLYRMLTEKNASYNMRPHIRLNNRTPHYLHFLKDRRKINVIAKVILDIKQRNIKAKAKTYTKHKLSRFRNKVNTKLKSKKTINRCNLLNVGSYV